jgi:putative methionine-R-sulfoxide reductase with GAF domain
LGTIGVGGRPQDRSSGSHDGALEPRAEAEDRLRDLKALTDARLGHLDVDDLLVELLDRVLLILDADTAAVLLLDEGSGELVARAARGLEEEVRQGVRIPLGRGFAGRVAAEKHPVILDRVDETTVTNPILWETGIKAMLGVPLLVGGDAIGVLHVGSRGGRRFTEDDAELLQVVADRVAGATQSRSLEVERAAARVLQRSLLPTALPRLPALEFAARYMPAEETGIGGDWYDVFVLPSGEVWVITGDVAGHGFHAAVVMGRLRSTIRAYALDGRPPEEVLDLTDRKIQHFEADEMATVVCAASPPPFDTVHVASAGHLPPLLAVPGCETTLVETEISPPLGTTEVTRGSVSVAMPAGALLFLYTDGLVERRGEPLDVGFERLRSVVAATSADGVCKRAIDVLFASTAPADDVAMLAMRRRAVD